MRKKRTNGEGYFQPENPTQLADLKYLLAEVPEALVGVTQQQAELSYEDFKFDFTTEESIDQQSQFLS